MYILTKADLVWTRAFSDDPGTGVGDQHLRAMAKPYGRAMGSGVSMVMDTSTAEEVHRAADAFDYLGLTDLATLTRRLIDADWFEDDLEDRLNQAWSGLEAALAGAFERTYAESPNDFDPLVPDGVERLAGSWSSDDRQGKKVCAGQLIVHEREVVCAQGDACPGTTPGVLHSRSRLHAEAGCELCPSGPTWAT